MQMGPPTHRTTIGMFCRHASLIPVATSAADPHAHQQHSRVRACLADTGHGGQLTYSWITTDDQGWCRINGGYKGVDFVGNIACPNIDFATLHVCELLCLLPQQPDTCYRCPGHAANSVLGHDALGTPPCITTRSRVCDNV